ncbi:flagellar biosynthesis protein FliO [Neorhizobium sp. R1-B]|uniref:flagellar biosynthetic protein FliO n=1 Tax=unclassified Neorhizobium TaxID=2629175 RepID=UPI000DDABC66|nr:MULTISPECIES: flagellar biosynthetic protein FliO [unclassified Neorhizobium]TCV64390.1 flagellar biosynthesis protein FliO [Neorhizobium sp. S3-V5DH]TDX74112.1 flagellar biosynthesis protein FliO [Neorhizobium sp. R1-B]
MFGDLLGTYGSRLVIAVVGVGVGLLLLAGVLWMIRGRNGPSPFVRGGKNRQPRLQVLDAAAVDTRRRLVLVRRDDIEHLIMIGGPTDIVIESGISTAANLTPAASLRPVSRDLPSAPPAEPPAENRAMPVEPRPAPPQRPSAAEPRGQAVREGLPLREPPRSSSAMPVRAAGTSAPASTAAPKVELPARPAPEAQAEPSRPIAALAAAATTAHPLASSTNRIDVARPEVSQDAEESRIVPVTPQTVPASLQSAADKPQQLGSDFDRLLEEEMAHNLATRDPAILGQSNRRTPPHEAAVPLVTGATPEPSLQTEVTRIFGEMSATRDK